MKGDRLSRSLALVLSVSIITSGCATNPGVQEKRTRIVTQTAQFLRVPGKIYVKDNILFVNELAEGVHIIDNTNPSQPELIGFIVRSMMTHPATGLLQTFGVDFMGKFDIGPPQFSEDIIMGQKVFFFLGHRRLPPGDADYN